MKTVIIYDADNMEASDYTVVTVGENNNEICITGSRSSVYTVCLTNVWYHSSRERYFHTGEGYPLYSLNLDELFFRPLIATLDTAYAIIEPVWDGLHGERIYIERREFPPEALSEGSGTYIDKTNQYYHISLKRLNGPYTYTYGVMLTPRECVEVHSDESEEVEIKTSASRVGDTGWIPLELTSDFIPYNNVDSDAPEYRMIGNIVHLRGNVSPTSTITGGSTYITIGTLPEQVRPSKTEYFIVQGSGRNIWLLSITGSGAVRFSRYRAGDTYENATTSAWLPFAVTFFAGVM